MPVTLQLLSTTSCRSSLKIQSLLCTSHKPSPSNLLPHSHLQKHVLSVLHVAGNAMKPRCLWTCWLPSGTCALTNFWVTRQSCSLNNGQRPSLCIPAWWILDILTTTWARLLTSGHQNTETRSLHISGEFWKPGAAQAVYSQVRVPQSSRGSCEVSVGIMEFNLKLC